MKFFYGVSDQKLRTINSFYLCFDKLLSTPAPDVFIFEFKNLSIFSLYAKSSRPKVFCKKGVFKNFAKFTRIQLCWCWSLFFIKLQVLRPASLLKTVKVPEIIKRIFFFHHWRTLKRDKCAR